MLNKKVYHLSHTDLDGYGCQLVTNSIFKNIEFFNSGYGPSIQKELEKIFFNIDNSNEESLILITDLNLDLNTATWLANEVVLRAKKGIDLILLDHHLSGKEASKTFSWYNLDEKYSATKLTYLKFKHLLPKKDRFLKAFVSAVNSYDLWKEDAGNFYIGDYLSYSLFNIKYPFPKELSEENRKFIFHILYLISTFLFRGTTIKKMETELINIIKLSYIKDSIPLEIFFNDNMIIDNKFNYYSYELLKDKMEIILIGKFKLVLFFGFDGTVFQNLSHIFNKNKNGFDGCINITESGNISLRSKGSEEHSDMSLLARTYFNGNGHFNASGGSLCNYEKNRKFTLEEVKFILNEKNQAE